MVGRKKKIGIGIENYKMMIEKECYYVDKTLLIKELLDRGGLVNLFTRPRRFGKTLSLSMLQTFFEAEIDENGKAVDNRRYFEGMKIGEAGKEYFDHMGQYPVIRLSLKSAKQPDFEIAYKCLRDEIAWEFQRHRYLLKADGMEETDKEKYRTLRDGKGDYQQYATSLLFLSRCLKQYHGKKVIILIDEYDVPLENAWFREFYDRMTDFIRSLFESALKTNDYLEFAVVTCCLRISKESIFTGLNNLKVISVLNDSFAEYFGFVQSEVCEMLENFGVGDKAEEVKQWYDGYLFGSTEVYNPWSVINYVDDAISQKVFFPKPYWSNTSSNSIVKELIEGADAGVREEIEELIGGGTIEKPVHEDITYGEIHETKENLWNFLFLTGYLKAVSQRFDRNQIYLTMRIPNEEIRYIYDNTIREWFAVKLKAVDFTSFYRTIMEGDSTAFETAVKGHLRESISFYDRKEGFYHGFLLGLLGALQYYEVVSNRESGDGRPDIMLKPYDELEPAVIMEIKCVEKFTLMEAACDKALEQIEKMDYEAGLLEEGYRKIWKYGICFCKKSCMVKLAGDGSR